MSASQKGKPKPHLRGRKRPGHSATMKAWWTEERRQQKAKEMKKRNEDPEWQRRMSERFAGEKNPRWRGGISNQEYAPGFSRTLKRKIRKRDNHQCQLCGKTEEQLGYRLSIHHAQYDKTNHDPSNLFALCKACNSRVNTNRDVWQSYFSAIAENRRKLGKNVSDLVSRKVFTQHESFIVFDVDDGDIPLGSMIAASIGWG
jgi:5-methylcytosine-specific restriction endonuclease McrA